MTEECVTVVMPRATAELLVRALSDLTQLRAIVPALAAQDYTDSDLRSIIRMVDISLYGGQQ